MWQTILKFGLNHCDLPTMIWNISILLRVLTLNVDPGYDKKIPIIFYIWTIVICSCYFYVYVFSMIWFVFWKCIETGDVIAAMVVFSLGISSEISTVKLIYMFIYQGKIRNTIEKYLAYDSMGILNNRFWENRLKALRRVKKRAMIFWVMIMSNGVAYIMKPLLMSGRHSMEDTEFLYGLQPMHESPNYEISYFLSMGGVIFACYVTANISGFFIIVTGYIEAQITALSEELMEIWDDAQEHYQKYTIRRKIITENDNSQGFNKQKIVNEYIKKQLHVIIIMHTTNISFLRQIEQTFRSSIAIEFGLLIVSLISEFLGGLENTYMQMPFALIQVTMDCITGQRLLDSSLLFEKSVYGCKWENFNVSNMKIVKTMLIMSQKNMKLTAGGFASLSYLCLMTVSRMIYSTYTALRSTLHR